MIKIYDTDSEVYGRTTKKKAKRTKDEIDGILARFQIKDVLWHWDIENNDVFVMFKLPPEKFRDTELADLSVKLEPPRIWHKTTKGESINWDASMRNMYWYILTHLSQAYVHQSSKFTEFLPHILNPEGRKVIDVVREEFLALPEKIINKKLIQR
ncbi:hypothetical protein ES702_01826 [subsurface metagenome]